MSASIDLLPRKEQEPVSVVPYEEYRILSDTTQPDIYRKAGISSAGDYTAVQADARTVYIEIDGRNIPLFASIEHAGGYNIESCNRLTGKENVFALALSPEYIATMDIDMSSYLAELGENSAVLVQTAAERTEEVKMRIAGQLPVEAGWAAHDFIDPRCPEGHQRACISVYTAQFESLDRNGELRPRTDRTLRELFEEDKKEAGNDHTELIEASDIINNDELFEQLWALHDNKFDWLGTYHPVSMQENKEFFRQILLDERTKSFVRFDTNEEGKRVPVCHGCAMDGLDQIDWLNDRFKQEITTEANESSQNIHFFYGIASQSKPDKMLHYAQDVMNLDSRLVAKGGGKTTLVFESTNMSSLYIPRLVQQYLGEEPNGVTMTGDIHTESQVDYWYLASGSRDTV